MCGAGTRAPRSCERKCGARVTAPGPPGRECGAEPGSGRGERAVRRERSPLVYPVRLARILPSDAPAECTAGIFPAGGGKPAFRAREARRGRFSGAF